MPTQAEPEGTSWQVLQLPLTPVWIMDAVGAGVAKPVPGTEVDALAATRPEGLLPAWQFSHVVLVGRCDVAAAGDVGGITVRRVMP